MTAIAHNPSSCVTKTGPFDWYGHRRTVAGVGLIQGGTAWPNEGHEAGYLTRTPTRWEDDEEYDPTIADYYTSQDAGWAISYADSGDAETSERIGIVNMSIAPYTSAGETCYTRRTSAQLLSLDDNELAALASWTEGAKADLVATKLQAANTPGVDSIAVELTHTLADSTPGDGSFPDYFRLILEGAADEAEWVYIFIQGLNGVFDISLWANLSTHTWGNSSTGHYGTSVRDGGLWVSGSTLHCKISSGAISAPITILVRVVDGNGLTVFNGVDGDGLVITKLELRQELVTADGIELAYFDVDGEANTWRLDLPTSDIDATIVDATSPWYQTIIDDISETDVVTSAYPVRQSPGIGFIGMGILEGRLGSLGIGQGINSAASGCCSADNGAIWFYTSDGQNGEDGTLILRYDATDGAMTYEVGLGHIANGYIQYALPYLDLGNFPTLYPGGPERYYYPQGSVNDLYLPVLAALDGGSTCGIIVPRTWSVEDSVTEPPLPDAIDNPLPYNGYNWYDTVAVNNYCAITAGNYSYQEYDLRVTDYEDAVLAENQWPEWFDAGYLPLIHGPAAVLWDDELEIDRLFTWSNIGGTFDDPGYDDPWVLTGIGSATASGVHCWSNMVSGWYAYNNGMHAAIFTHGRASISITGTVPWKGWEEGAEDPPVDFPEETEPELSHWVTLAMGATTSGTPGVVGSSNVVTDYDIQIWRDDERLQLTGLRAIQPEAGTSRKGFAFAEVVWHEGQAPSEGAAGVQSHWRLVFRTKEGEIWTVENHSGFYPYAGSPTPRVVTSSDGWIYVAWFDWAKLEDVETKVVGTTIPDDGTPLESTIAAPYSGIVDIGAIAVTVNINHDNVGSLKLTLIDPALNEFVLCDGKGGTGNNFTGTRFIATGATTVPVAATAAPFTGDYRPEDPFFPTLQGQNGEGDWILRVEDQDNDAIVGTLVSWTLELGHRRSHWVFSQEELDGAPRYAWYPRIDDGAVPDNTDPFPNFELDVVKRRGLVPLTPDVQQY